MHKNIFNVLQANTYYTSTHKYTYALILHIDTHIYRKHVDSNLSIDKQSNITHKLTHTHAYTNTHIHTHTHNIQTSTIRVHGRLP